MTEITGLDYIKLSKKERFKYNFLHFLHKIPLFFKNLGIKIAKFAVKFGKGFVNYFKTLFLTFKDGDWKTRTSFFIMGFGSFARKQIFRGILFLGFQVIFILYMIFYGGYYIGKLNSLGYYYEATKTTASGEVVYGVNSFDVLLFGIMSLFFIAAFLWTWNQNIKQNRINQQIEAENKHIATAKDDLRAIVDKDFHRTLLTIPTIGILIFTLLPIFFMILVAFTSYDKNHMPPVNLFGWVGGDNFRQLFTWSAGANNFSATFGAILIWTLVWAFFATFSNYFIGMMIAMLINKKGIKLKKLWRTVLVLSIAIPQFISLLYVGQMFQSDGIINNLITSMGGKAINFWGDPTLARITVIVINIWIGIPYVMLITTGILMNIPADLYESANIDGASPWQQYSKITLPYMLFVTGPYLLTSFTGNMNNFNVIYLLTGGGPSNNQLHQSANGDTDLLITWLFNLAISNQDYKLAAVIGIMVFIVVAVISLIVYNLIPSTRNEEEFQ